MRRILQTIESSRSWRIAVLMIVSVLVAGYFFLTAFQHPGGVMYSAAGDGIKNYYTPMWYVAHDSSAMFSGMNYPYPETMVYSDNQPLVSYSLKCLSHYVHITSSQVLAVLNLLPIFSLLFCCLLVFYLLRRANLPYWYALFFAVIISFHSPQVARLLGAHYGLSYTCFVPLMWVCIDSVLNRRWAMVWGAVTAAILLAFTFLHLYYLPIGFFMAVGYGLLHLVQQRKYFKSHYLRYAILMFAAIIPFVVLKLWVTQYDHYTDRVAIPYGLDIYHASFYSLFIPWYAPHPYSAYYNFEGVAYIGWFGLIVLAITLFKSGSYLLRRQFNKMAVPVAPSILQVAPWLAVLFFFLANACIFLLLSNLLPTAFERLRQFRSVGRFAWVFYYLFSCWSVWLLYLMLRRLRMKGLGQLARTALFVFCALSVYETYFYLLPIKKQLRYSHQENEARNFLTAQNNYADWVKSAGYKTSDFQAILPIPFFNMGDEKVGSIYSPSTVFETLKASLSTGLPIATAYTARASVGQTDRVIQMLSSPYIRKTILKDYPSLTKPLLIVCTKKDMQLDDATMLSHAKRIFSNEYVELYSLEPTILDSIYFRSIASVKQQVDSGKVAAPIIFEGFDNASKVGITGGGAFTAGADSGLVGKWILPASLQEDTLIFSCWVKILLRYNGMAQLHFNLSGRNGNSTIISNPANSHDVYGDWVITQDTIVAKGGDSIIFSAEGKETVLDNFQVRYKHQHAWQKYAGDSIAGFFDGYLIPRKDADGK